MRKKHEITEEEKEEFRKAVRNIKPLSHKKVTHEVAAPPPPLKKRNEDLAESPFNFYDSENLPEVEGNEIIEFTRPGLQHKILRKLRAGQYNVEAMLDMHGMNVEEARDNLAQFLMHCQRKNIRHVLIIHGKGHQSPKPILKNKVNQWLRQTPYVLAFCSATGREGRGGALYVLLKGR